MPTFSAPGSAGSYELDDDPARIDPAAAAAFLTTAAYWGRWRAEPDIRRQIEPIQAGWWEDPALTCFWEKGELRPVESAPPGMTIDEKTGRIQWEVPAASAGVYRVKVLVKDDHQGWALQEFNVTLGNSVTAKR